MDKRDLKYLLKNNLIDEPDWYIEILESLEKVFKASDESVDLSIEIKDFLGDLIINNK